MSTCVHLWTLFFALFLTGCSELQKPKTEPFYAQNPPPPKQEFRWSNGKMPKSFDPALAAASPEADFARALYEGLTDFDSKTLQPVPAVSTKWTASEDFKTWTFTLRQDAKWSNGERVTAKDFVRSWKRLVELGDKVPQRPLLKNIVGMDTENVLPIFAEEETDGVLEGNAENDFLSSNKQVVVASNTVETKESNDAAAPEAEAPKTAEPQDKPKTSKLVQKKEVFGVEAVNDFTLKVSLVQPDRNFAALVAHPMFRPVYEGGKDLQSGELKVNIVTNGAFRLSAVERDGVVLDRADSYWGARETKLERVRFVPTENAESALDAYRAGEIDAVTNVDFKPLALKLLTPYDDFRRTTHGALNFYEFNPEKPQFKDARIRKAMAMAIERERLTEDEMDGASRPALTFSPFSDEEKLSQDVAGAQKLLAEAGFPEGKDFPAVRLLVNRNDMQRRIARAVAKMWKKNLNVETEIIVEDQADFEAAFQNGEYDVVRRGAVLPTTDETANLLAMFPARPEPKVEQLPNSGESNIAAPTAAGNQILSEKSAESNLNLVARPNASEAEKEVSSSSAATAQETSERAPLLTERQALETLPAIPLYFPTSYSLVKPYVQGFEMNALDAPSLKNVRINNNWQPANQKILSNEQK